MMLPTRTSSAARRALAGASVTALAMVVQGCVSVRNYTDAAGPRYAAPAGAPAAVSPAVAAPSTSRTLGVASFNIEEGRDIDGALDVLKEHPELHGADFLLLQEMDAEGTARIADALGLAWVYYPAALRNGRDFGNAVLSRWPIVDDAKILLPHTSIFGESRRTATAVTALVDGEPVRVYSVHLATPLNLMRDEREDQFRAVLDDAQGWDRVIIGGDLNSDSMAELALAQGYLWPTARGPRTVWFSRVDHILYRGLVPLWSASSGTVADNRDASDHLPVWARGRLRPPEADDPTGMGAGGPAADPSTASGGPLTPFPSLLESHSSTPRTTVFLVGDAGNAEGPSALLEQLGEEVAGAARSAPTVVVFLGDNVYPAGVRPPGQGFHRDTTVLRNQLDVVAGSEARALFIPGNHDWDDGGEDGMGALARQAAFFRRAAQAGAAVRFLPEAGCPGPIPVDLPGLRLVALDTHWFLHDHARGCADRTEAQVGEAVTGALDDAGDRETLVVAHHPLRTHGPHGGYFPADRHLFPLRELASWAWVPLPVLGSTYVAVRQSGVTDQDLSGDDNRALQRTLEAAFRRARRPPLLLAAGHEHSLQVLRGADGGPVLHLVSGAGSKSTPVGRGEDTAFAGDAPGYMRVDVMGPATGSGAGAGTAEVGAGTGEAGAGTAEVGAGTGEAGAGTGSGIRVLVRTVPSRGNGIDGAGAAWCGWIDAGSRTVRSCR